MQSSGTLERLEVRGCSLTDEGMTTLSAGIRHGHALQHVGLSNNKFGVAGAAALAAAVGSCPALTSLDVSGTMIGDAGLSALAPTLISVRSLDLRNCGLTSQSGESLAWLIEHSRALLSLSANWNQLGPRGVAVLAAALQPSSSLRTLHAQGCDAGADGAAALADALRRGWRASELRLGVDLTMDDSAALALAAALTECGNHCTVATLALSECSVTAAGALALVRAATAIPRLQSLDLGCNGAIQAADKPALIAACGPQPLFALGLRR
jgi:Ran GTPase-activating protein (RanGAP) involved in mRNA processing and transport